MERAPNLNGPRMVLFCLCCSDPETLHMHLQIVRSVVLLANDPVPSVCTVATQLLKFIKEVRAVTGVLWQGLGGTLATVQCSTVQNSAVQSSAVQYSTARSNQTSTGCGLWPDFPSQHLDGCR